MQITILIGGINLIDINYDKYRHNLTLKTKSYTHHYDSTSNPLLSPNKEYVAFISPFEWECHGYVYLMNIASGKVEDVPLKLDNDLTVKELVWKNNNTLLLLIGSVWGTINVGGDLYSYNISKKKLKLLKRFEKRIQIKNIHITGEHTLLLSGIKYNDDIFNEFDQYDIEYTMK